ncbi:MAG TPA: hypothetical protein ENJ07_02150 [Gammaproteobacteria bacterium]|nr:hypothetical protein [Gammaproteobacteria bacterium]
MNKKLIALSVAAAFAAPMAAQADSASVSGFADITLGITDDANPANEMLFGANGEVDFVKTVGAVTARVDVDLFLDPANSAGANIEQALFAWGLTDTVTFIGGVFNNPIGQEAEDAPDKNFTSSSMVYRALDNQTVLDGNNIAGVAVAANLGVATVTVAALNDIQHAPEENSVAFVVNSSPVAGLDLELGYVTQATGVENVLDINASYAIQGATIGFDYLVPDELLDSVFDVWAGYDFGNNFGAKVRYSACSDAASGATCNAVFGEESSTTLYGSYQAAENLLVSVEWRSGDNGTDTSDTLGAEFIATF